MQLEQLNNLADKLATEAKLIVTQIADFCQHYATEVRQQPALRGLLLDRGLTALFLKKAEEIGNGIKDARLLLPSGSQYKSLYACSLSIQQDTLDNGVEVWDAQAQDIRRIPMDDLSPKQVQQVFHAGNLRNIAQQRTWLAEQTPNIESAASDLDYQVTKKYVVTRRPGKWSRALIKQWATEMGIL